ncbi:hypothetical protein Lser_V15G15685 [Lactuca serriola]
MKIFSWVHRRFHKKSVADEDAKKVENDKVSLLENEALAGVCDGWKEGILAIGTLGIDLSKTFQVKDVAYTDNQLLLFGHDDDEEDQEGEMEWPLVLKACKHGFHHVQKQDPSPCDKVAKPNNGKEEVDAKDPTNLNTECTEKKIMNCGERTTLADLLWGDSEKNLLKEKLCDPFNVPYHVSTCTESIKSTLISKKKKIEKDDSTHPIKKTKRLMRKMLKKKIYPDIASQKKETEGIIYQDIHVHAT